LPSFAASLPIFAASSPMELAPPRIWSAMLLNAEAIDVVGGLHGTRRGSDTNTFQTLFHRSQAPFDFTDIGGHRAGISGLTKHHEAPSELRRITIDRECSWHSHAVLAQSLSARDKWLG
jgi:hypothetical protein